jgi:hypothetical protein
MDRSGGHGIGFHTAGLDEQGHRFLDHDSYPNLCAQGLASKQSKGSKPDLRRQSYWPESVLDLGKSPTANDSSTDPTKDSSIPRYQYRHERGTLLL